MTLGQWEVEIPSTASTFGLEEEGTVNDAHASAMMRKVRGMNAVLEGDVMSIPRDPDVAYGQSNLCFRDLAFSIKCRHVNNGSEKVILTPTSGAYLAGSMVALMVRGGGRGEEEEKPDLSTNNSDSNDNDNSNKSWSSVNRPVHLSS